MVDVQPAIPALAQPVLVPLPAEIDLASADRVGEQIAAACAPGGKIVIADMTGTTFCDSLGIRVLVRASRWARINGAELRILVPSADIMRVMEILGVDAVLPLYQSLEEALSGVRSKSH